MLCLICYDNIYFNCHKIVCEICHNMICDTCYKSLINNICPVCREPYNDNIPICYSIYIFTYLLNNCLKCRYYLKSCVNKCFTLTKQYLINMAKLIAMLSVIFISYLLGYLLTKKIYGAIIILNIILGGLIFLFSLFCIMGLCSIVHYCYFISIQNTRDRDPFRSVHGVL